MNEKDVKECQSDRHGRIRIFFFGNYFVALIKIFKFNMTDMLIKKIKISFSKIVSS